MSHELEVAGAASLGGLTSGEHHQVEPPGEPCRNCGTIVAERYCTRCGQLASNFHRPFFSLIMSSLADTFALDSRLWRTVPMLLFRPGRVTRNYLDGKRARYVPPFRLFLLASVLFFLTVFGLGDRLGWYADWKLNLNGGEGAIVSEADRTAALAEMQGQLADPDLTPEAKAAIEAAMAQMESAPTVPDGVISEGKVDRHALNEVLDEQTGITGADAEKVHQAADRVANVFENQDRFGARLREWAPRFSLLFAPLLALMLTGLYAWRRGVYVYDHVITALHFQTFVYGLSTLLLLAAAFLHVPPAWLATAGSAWGIWYLYRQLRVTYATGPVMAGLRTSILLILGITVLFLLGIGLVVLSFLLT